MMAKSFPATHIKTHRVYTVWETADVLGCHRQTIIRWIKTKGLIAVTTQRPWLIEGRELRRFLGVRKARQQVSLALHHCYCLGCKSPREPDGKIADYVQQTPKTGRLIGLCPACGSLMNKIVKRVDLEAIRAKIEVTVQKASPRLVSRTDPPTNVTFNREASNHGKAQR